jgi:sortilin (neurotensin receptor 3)
MPKRVIRCAWRSVSAMVIPLATAPLGAQGGGQPAAAPAPMINQSSDPLLRPFRFRNIGPASMGGRLDDIAVSESSPNVIYLGYAVGGVWKSENNGTTYTPVFDTYEVASIGDIAIHPTNPDIVYVGTGESNNRQTSSFGAGMYKTTDGGKTWTYLGLRETQSIARIVLDPRNPETVYVAANGHLFGPNEDRGVYKSTNGGRTFTKVKYVDENTGFTDIAIDHSNPSVLYAASYQRRRTTCCFNGGGSGSAIWKTTNGAHRARRLALEPEHRLRADRGRQRRAGPAAGPGSRRRRRRLRRRWVQLVQQRRSGSRIRWPGRRRWRGPRW